MEDDKFDLIFRGEIVPSAELAQVKKNLAHLFKIPGDKVETLFSGQAITLKKAMSAEQANQYRVAIKKAGARVEIQASQPISPPKPSTGRAQFKVPDDEAPVAEPKPEIMEQPGEPEEGGLSLAPLGGDLLAPSEKTQPEPANINISGLSLRAPEGNLVDYEELERPAPVILDSVDFDLAPVGVNLLKPEEVIQMPQLDIDLSALDLAPVGADLSQPKPAPPPPPDTSNLSLVDD